MQKKVSKLACGAALISYLICSHFSRPKSKTASAPGSVTHTPVPTDPTMEMLHDRITLANAISALEDDAQDDNYTATVDDNVLPVGAEEMGSGL